MSVRLWKKPSIRQGSFQEIVETARQAFLFDNPNPERKGCPAPQLLMDLAFRRADKAQRDARYAAFEGMLRLFPGSE